MIVEGEKYACDACIRGHRVSSCTHRDRKLNHVNKKGRPLTQCPHCRGLRKSRAAHVKCECGEGGHVSASSSDTTGCKCQTGVRCSCALKKESSEVHDLYRTHSASRRYGQKPGMPGHRSDSAVPRIKAPIPPMHRLHHIHHDHGHPYSLSKSKYLADGLHRSQSSLDGSQGSPRLSTIYQSPQMSAGAPALTRQLSNPVRSTPSPLMLHRQLSNPVYGTPSPRSRPILSSLRTGSPAPMPDFSASLDASTMYKALSPGNPARYSFHDIPDFSLDSMSRNLPENTFNVEDWVQMPLFDTNGNLIEQHPITPSDASVEYSLSSQFGVSSSGTNSDTGDITAQPIDYARQNLPYRSTPTQPDVNTKPMTPPVWLQDAPIYAMSDPGVFNGQSQFDYTMQDVQTTDAAIASFAPSNMDQYELPMMTEEAVRDWLHNPVQMQDPNYDFEVPTQFMPPMMEGTGNYGWI